MIPAEYYTEVNTKSQLVDSLWDLILDKENWHTYYSFTGKHVDKDLWEKDIFLKKLSEKYVLLVGILSVPPNTVYNWHIDVGNHCRKLGINMLLSNSPSHCLFTDNSDVVLSNTIELQYQPNTYYVLNTQQKHTVINLNTQRYILSVAIVGEHVQGTHIEYDIDSTIKYCDFVNELTRGDYE